MSGRGKSLPYLASPGSLHISWPLVHDLQWPLVHDLLQPGFHNVLREPRVHGRICGRPVLMHGKCWSLGSCITRPFGRAHNDRLIGCNLQHKLEICGSRSWARSCLSEVSLQQHQKHELGNLKVPRIGQHPVSWSARNSASVSVVNGQALQLLLHRHRRYYQASITIPHHSCVKVMPRRILALVLQPTLFHVRA